MKLVGMIGGIGPESTVEYYRLIQQLYRARAQDESYPPLIINSIDLTRMLGLVGDPDALAAYLLEEVHRLARAGAEIAFFASNTPHLVFNQVARQSPIPLISIVEAACEEATKRGLRKLGLFGARFTMQGRFFAEIFSREGIVLLVPRPEEQAYIHHVYMTELLNRILRLETRERLLAIAERLRDEERAEGIILAGTELSPLLRDASLPGLIFLDTAEIHARAVVARMLSEAP